MEAGTTPVLTGWRGTSPHSRGSDRRGLANRQVRRLFVAPSAVPCWKPADRGHSVNQAPKCHRFLPDPQFGHVQPRVSPSPEAQPCRGRQHNLRASPETMLPGPVMRGPTPSAPERGRDPGGRRARSSKVMEIICGTGHVRRDRRQEVVTPAYRFTFVGWGIQVRCRQHFHPVPGKGSLGTRRADASDLHVYASFTVPSG